MTRPGGTTLVVPLACVLLAVACVAEARADPPTIEDCDARVAASPGDLGVYYCYVNAAHTSGRFDDAIRRLEALLALDPGLHRARLNIAVLEHDLGRPRAAEKYLKTIEGLKDANDPWGLVYAHSGLGAFLDTVGRREEAGSQFERALEVARESGQPFMLAHAQVRAAGHADSLMDYGTALRLFREAEEVVFPDGPAYLKSWILSGLGRVWWALGELRRAMEVYQREAENLRQMGDRFNEAGTRHNIALIAGMLADRGQADPAIVHPLAEQALQAALESGNRSSEGTSRLLLADDLRGRERVEETRKAILALEGTGSLENLLLARRQLAESIFYLGPEHYEQARSLLEEAIAEARVVGDRFSEARGLIMSATFRMFGGSSRDRIIAGFHEAIDAVEAIRELQPDHSIRTRSFGEWSFVYARLAGYLLEGLPESAQPDSDLELAFRAVERMRARTLLEMLDAAGVEGHGTPEIPDLRRVRDLLDPGQALLAFHLHSHRFDEDPTAFVESGGSWVLCITRNAVRAFSIPVRRELEERVLVYRGTFAARDGGEAVPAVRLYADLLADAIGALPEQIDRLVIVPDGVLYELPFETLRAGLDEPPLVSRFEIAYTPSVTLWTRFRTTSVEPDGTPRVFAVADPDLGVAAVSRMRDADPWIDRLELARLPHGSREARRLLRSLGGQGTLLEGASATEGAVKSADLTAFDVLHFAAHAVVDRARPERSAVVLAPAAGQDDGLLQMGEIADLDLDGQLVILGACRSASGRLVDGEGMVGLSRAFFQAGARTVVGSVWPLRDDETADLVEDFSRELGSGLSVAAALAETRRGRIAAGVPPAAWAGLVVLGDGDLVLTEGSSRLLLRPRILVPAFALLLVILWLRRRFASSLILLEPPRPGSPCP